MKKGDSRKKTGFTIIEVALVLAIAGLIFFFFFVALPSLQRSQRGAARWYRKRNCRRFRH